MSEPSPNNGSNNRVTLAVLQRDIQHLTEKVEAYHDETVRDRDACRAQVKLEMGDHETRLRDLEHQKGWVVFRDVGAYIVAIAAGATAALTSK